jgi:transposase
MVHDLRIVLRLADVVERSISWMRRFRRLAKDYERLPETVAGLHFLAFAWLLLSRAVKLFASAA